MSETTEKFFEMAATKSADKEHRRKLLFNIGKYNDAVVKGKEQYANLELARQRAKNIKWKAIEQLDKMLVQFESNFTNNGGTVIWAQTGEEAIQEIYKIAEAAGAKRVVKSKSMVTEEIHLNDALKAKNIESVETDLGEYIQQLDGEAPYHIVTPAMHKSKEDVARVFHEHLGTPIDYTPEQLTLEARARLREKYLSSDIGVTGANFIIADTGSILVLENEGNARLTTSFPKIHIAIVGIEKMIPSINDLALFLPLLATYGTGQKVSVYNSIFSGPKRAEEIDGPEQMYVILLDNGRTNLLAQAEQREALYCIRCGSCLNACPVYKNIGGHTYGTTYSGPIGSVITPHFKGMEEFKHLSHASSLCGNCTEVCPMKINLHELLLLNRRDAVREGHVKGTEKTGWMAWKWGMSNRLFMNTGSAKMRNYILTRYFSNSWGKHHDMLKFPKKSFNQMWKDKKKGAE
jgi:L-lactate dehydrogenase complex protein LldF